MDQYVYYGFVAIVSNKLVMEYLGGGSGLDLVRKSPCAILSLSLLTVPVKIRTF